MWLQLYSVTLNLAVALFCGVLIGTERQARQRTAGVRTNALVAIGAASFVIFAGLFPGEASPTRVAAQVVSGIGFLGAGIIFREGLNIHGLNTAATLWCSAAVGLMSGVGAWHLAAVLTGYVMFINLGLRPVVKWLKRKTNPAHIEHKTFHLQVICKNEHQTAVRLVLLKTFERNHFQIAGIATKDLDNNTVGITVECATNSTGFADIEKVIRDLVTESFLLKVQLVDAD